MESVKNCLMYKTNITTNQNHNIMEQDLTTLEGRRLAVANLESEFLNELKEKGIELSQDVKCSISNGVIVIGIRSFGEYAKRGFEVAFGSEIELKRKRTDENDYGFSDNEINFGSSGDFTPNNVSSYWKTIHAASVLKNWSIVSELVNKYCGLYNELIIKVKSLVNNQTN